MESYSCKDKKYGCSCSSYIDEELIRPGVGVCTCGGGSCRGTCRGMKK